MPTGTPYSSLIRPYAIRVDDFSDTASLKIIPSLHALTHTHSDHITGLSSKSFAHTVICSEDAKEMLLRHEVFAERKLREMDMRAENVRTFKHLKVHPRTLDDGTVFYHGSRDLLKILPLNTPTSCELSHNHSVTITLIDANHCPGAVMLLIEGPLGAVLHTGDFRAEPWFLESIKKNPFLEKYLAEPMTCPGSSYAGRRVGETLEAIYLDTACLLSTKSIPSKDEATSGLMSLMKLYPSSTLFFINGWTWGYEDVYKAIARTFQTKIHVDRYKYGVYSHLKREPFLKSIVTREETETRFHACERFDRCSQVKVDGRASHTAAGNHVVYVNPVTMGQAEWQSYVRNTEDRLKSGETVNHLLVALSRHSPLPELQSFVSMFKPKRVVPNTLDPKFNGLDWAAMPGMFAGCLSSDDVAFRAEVRQAISEEIGADWASVSMDLDGGEDVALANLEGDGASEVARAWADEGKTRRKLEILIDFLDGPERQVVERLLRGDAPREAESQTQDVWNEVAARPPPAGSPERRGTTTGFQGKASEAETARAMARFGTTRFASTKVLQPDSDEDTEDEDAEEARARTAHYIFGMASQLPDPTATSSSPIRSPIRESTNDERLAAPAEPSRRILPLSSPAMPFAPVTPQSSPRAVMVIGKHNEASAGFRENVGAVGPPKKAHQRPLGSPFQLLSPAPTARKRRLSEREQADAASEARPTGSDPPAEKTQPARFLDFRQTSKETALSLRSPQDSLKNVAEQETKRRKVSEGMRARSCLTESRPKTKLCVPQAEVAVKPEPPPGPRALGRTDTVQASVSARPDGSSASARAPKTHGRKSLSAMREKIAKRLSEVGSTSLKPPYRRLKRSESAASAPLSLSQRSLRASAYPEQLPSSDDPNVEMGAERREELVQRFKAEYAKGVRPGKVIPRLECLQSQSP